jgi:hypothetical protein
MTIETLSKSASTENRLAARQCGVEQANSRLSPRVGSYGAVIEFSGEANSTSMSSPPAERGCDVMLAW